MCTVYIQCMQEVMYTVLNECYSMHAKTWYSKEVEQGVWQGSQSVLSLFGAWWWISFNTGKHCCLWCNISSGEMAQPLKDRGCSQPRTLESLQADYHRFQAAGGRLRNAKLYHNVIAPHFFDIPISQVSTNEQRRASHLCTYIYTPCILIVIYYTGGNTMLAHQPWCFPQAVPIVWAARLSQSGPSTGHGKGQTGI